MIKTVTKDDSHYSLSIRILKSENKKQTAKFIVQTMLTWDYRNNGVPSFSGDFKRITIKKMAQSNNLVSFHLKHSSHTKQQKTF